MKYIPFLAAATLALSPDCSLWAQKPLIDQKLNNGGFENESLKPWFGQSDEPGCSIGSELAAEGKQCCRVRLAGKESERVIARLIQNLDKIDPAEGRHFVVTCDVAAVAEHSTPEISGEFVFFDGDAVVATIPLERPEGPFGDWAHLELPMAGEIPADWSGGKVQFRLFFFVDGGSPGELYELLVDNVSVVQKENL